MVQTAWGGAKDADRVALLIDAAKGLSEDTAEILKKLGEIRQPKDLVLNKIDLVDKGRLLGLSQALNRGGTFSATFMISALTGAASSCTMSSARSKMSHSPLGKALGSGHSSTPAKSPSGVCTTVWPWRSTMWAGANTPWPIKLATKRVAGRW